MAQAIRKKVVDMALAKAEEVYLSLVAGFDLPMHAALLNDEHRNALNEARSVLKDLLNGDHAVVGNDCLPAVTAQLDDRVEVTLEDLRLRNRVDGTAVCQEALDQVDDSLQQEVSKDPPPSVEETNVELDRLHAEFAETTSRADPDIAQGAWADFVENTFARHMEYACRACMCVCVCVCVYVLLKLCVCV